MNTLLKAALLIVYALAAASLLSPSSLPASWATGLQYATAILFVAHVLETAVMFRHVQRYRGPLGVSIALSLLFGMLHWKPLVNAAKRSAR